MIENIISAVALIATIAGLLLYFFKLRKKTNKQKGKESAYAVIWGVLIFASSFFLYMLAHSQTPQAETQSMSSIITSKLYIIAISLGRSIKMFGADIYYNEVKVIADGNLIYRVAICICFISACFWTFIMVKKIFLKGVTNEFKVWLHSTRLFIKLFQKKDKYHYIIIGCEKSMKVFLSDLEKNASKDNITIITGEVLEKEIKTVDRFKELVDDGYTVIEGKADETSLKKAGIDNTKRKTRVIAITECDEQNLKVADIITQKIISVIFPKETNLEDKEFLNRNIESLSFRAKSDKEYNELSAEEKSKENDNRIKYLKLRQQIINGLKNINLEAYIMYSFIERTEHFAFAENAYGKVDFFNPYELRVRDFFWEHPITSLIPHLIDTDKARLKGDFKADGKIYKPNGKEYLIKNIFVGFGNANYQMLKGSILTGQLLGCDYNATIYDENICEEKHSLNQAMFMNHSSGLFGGDQTLKEEEYFDSPKEKYNIFFKNGNILSKDFYIGTENSLINEVKNNDFTAIYIALGNDKHSIETACEIRQYLCEHDIGITQDKIRIFVKIREESVFSKNSVINNSQNIPIYIECFGQDNSILTKDNIISEPLDKFTQKVTNKNHETPWEFLGETKRDINRHVAMAIRTKLNFLGFDIVDKGKANKTVKDEEYKEKYAGFGNDRIKKIIELSEQIALYNNKLENEQDTEETKEELKKLKKERSGYILDYVQTDNGQPDGIISDTPRNNLARLEHLRWNTFYLIHGWTKKPKGKVGTENEDKRGTDNTGRQNKLTKQHACITTFDELISLRNLQAKKLCEKDTEISLEKAKIKLDTVWYDYNLMDELPTRLSESDKEISII